ncbi:feruloyl-CoA synthase [Paraburkholderia elongata]|uniref:feruloyl-CoA synthase n=1 Tax=Paraburkholderia elongata TaxID=2675747 RepID=UPI002E2B833B|nr:feruloyl-CoA synthase [Paraburkholderia elongata]
MSPLIGEQCVVLATPDIDQEVRADGSFILRSRAMLQPYGRSIVDWLVHWAACTPDAPFLAERIRSDGPASWRTVTYSQVLATVRSIGQALLDLPDGRLRPVVILSDNSVNHALMSLAAMYVGRPSATVSSAYARVAKDMTKLHAILKQLDPALVYVEDGEGYGLALANAPLNCPVVAKDAPCAGWLPFDTLTACKPHQAVDDAFAALAPGDIAKLLLTSGSTGSPKLVVNTHGMLSANQQMIAQCWPFVDRAAPVVVDWLPWSHTFGANHNFNLVLRNGGALYIDDGRPVPGLIERTVENLRDVCPTLHFNVPRGFDALAPFLETDHAFATRFFSRLQVLFYAAASLPATVRSHYERAALRTGHTGQVFFASAWGSTETAPLVTSVHFPGAVAGNIGVPAPGNELKFVPGGGKLEMRVRGPSVFPGYLNDPEATAAAFDEEGFYRIGDAGKLCDPLDANRGVMFDGRVAEDFKLSSGTWVSVGTLRIKAVSVLTPYALDIVIAGHDRDQIGLLVFPTKALRELAPELDGNADGEELGRHPTVRATLNTALRELARDAGSSQRAARVAILSAPPSLELGEVTDKGYINQRAVLSLRADDVTRLFSSADSVIVLG